MLMVDRAGAISNDELQWLRTQQVGAVAAYIGGRNSGGYGWTPTLVRNIQNAGLLVLPIYVGEQTHAACASCAAPDFGRGDQDAADAVGIWRDAYGQGPSPLCLDVEFGTYEQSADAMRYITDWCRGVSVRGYHPVIYGTPAIARDYPFPVATGFWMAWWIKRNPDLTQIANYARYAGLGWQYDDAWNGYDISRVDGGWWQSQTEDDMLKSQWMAGDVAGDARFFPTGFAVRTGFRRYWEDFGGLPAYGYPLSREYDRKQSDGSTLRVQWFERGRFEWHQGSAPQWYDTLVGLSGDELLNGVDAYAQDRQTYPDAFKPER